MCCRHGLASTSVLADVGAEGLQKQCHDVEQNGFRRHTSRRWIWVCECSECTRVMIAWNCGRGRYCAAIAEFIADSAGYPGQPQKLILADGGLVDSDLTVLQTQVAPFQHPILTFAQSATRRFF